MIKSPSSLVIAISAITLFAAPQTAYSKSFFESLFGSHEEKPKGPPPEETLQAPFPTDSVKVQAPNNELMSIYNEAQGQPKTTGVDNLAVPHRNEKQITEWTAGIVSQALTIMPKTWDKDVVGLEKNFTPYAATEYKTYIQKMNLIANLTSNNMRLQAISNGDGSILKEGAIGGTYHWLVQIPILTSFYKDDMQEVDTHENAQSQNLTVQVQIGRIPAKDNADIGLTIERWTVLSSSQ